jgi:transposase
MGKPLSDDLRVRVVDAVKDRLSRREAAELFGVSASSAIRWVALEQKTGSVSRRPMGGDHSSKLTEHRELVLELVAQEPDLTLQEIRQRLARHKIKVGYGSVWRFFAKERITVKKNSARGRTGPSGCRQGAPGPACPPERTGGGQAGVCR